MDRARGDTLAQLYAAHVPQAVRLAYVLTHDRQLAEDIAHDAFVRLSGKFAHLRNRDAFGAYLTRTVVNLCRNRFRRADTERAYLRKEAAQPQSHRRPDVETEQVLRAALLELPVRQRAAIFLRFYSDLSEQHIADALGCAPGTVKSLISRGLEGLRNADALHEEAQG